jgi:hypothetical protein
MKQHILINNLGFVLRNWFNYKNQWKMLVHLNKHEQQSWDL